MDKSTRLQADTLRVLASPVRLEILHRLADGPLEVGRVAEAVGLSQPNASQHLAVLRAAGLVEADRHGREIQYGLTDPVVLEACGLMRDVVQRRLARLALLAAEGPRFGDGVDRRGDTRVDPDHAFNLLARS